MEKQCKESDRSSNISDLKLDLRTGSSNSNVHCDMDYIPGAESETGSESVITRIGVPLAGPVNVPGQDLYRYSQDYTETNFPPKVICVFAHCSKNFNITKLSLLSLTLYVCLINFNRFRRAKIIMDMYHT